MQYSVFYCGRWDLENTATVSDLPVLEQGFRLASVHFSDYALINEMQSTFVQGDSQGSGTTTVMGPVHGGGMGSNVLGNTTLDMTPYWAPNDPNDRIAIVSACCNGRDGVDGPSVVLLKTAGGSLIEAQLSWGVRDW